MKEKRKILPFENNNLELVKKQFLRNFDESWYRVYKSNVEMYEKDGIDTGEHRRWLHYYKQKLEGRL